jgi:uracil-DNA glycosylase
VKRWLARAFDIVRLVAAGLCLGTALYWALEALRNDRDRHRFSVEADTGRPTGIRVTPLTRAETDWALLREVLGLRSVAER